VTWPFVRRNGIYLTELFQAEHAKHGDQRDVRISQRQPRQGSEQSDK
jgi:hypothetical protein